MGRRKKSVNPIAAPMLPPSKPNVFVRVPELSEEHMRRMTDGITPIELRCPILAAMRKGKR